MKIFNIISCLLFILSAALQYNDPDPYIWVPIYLYSAWLCYQAARKIYLPRGYLLGMVIYLLYAIYLFFIRHGVTDWLEHHQAKDIVESMKASKPWIEETREFGGLLLLVIVLGINWIAAPKNSK